MPKFKIVVEHGQLVRRTKLVEADSLDDAVDKAHEETWSGDHGWKIDHSYKVGSVDYDLCREVE